MSALIANSIKLKKKNDVGTSFVLVIIPTTLVCVLFGILVTIPTFSTILELFYFHAANEKAAFTYIMKDNGSIIRDGIHTSST